MRWGYNTNGCQDHPWDVAIRILADLGYQSVAITLDHNTINPFSPDLSGEVRRMKRLLDRFQLRTVIETGARYLLDPLHKHEPTMVSSDPARRQFRLEYLKRAIAIAVQLESDVVSFWSGTPEPDDTATPEVIDHRIAAALEELLRVAERASVCMALEAEPGMWIETTDDALRWIQRVPTGALGLTLDIGHVHCMSEGSIVEIVRRAAPHLRNIHLEDMRRGRHEHLPFGEGEMDFPPILAAIDQMGYTGGVHVELSRHSHAFPAVAREAMEFLRCQTSR